jgi:ATP-dependent Clp protease ATP-binding subunit ClpA
MVSMPSSRSRRRVEIPASQYDRLKMIADVEERTVASLAAELLGAALKSYQPMPPSTEGFAPTPPAARVLELARGDMPASLNHNYVGTEHLLMALVAEEHGIGGKVLRDLGVRFEEVSSSVEFMIGRMPGPAAAGPRGDTPRTRKVFALALSEATRLDHSFIGSGHLLLGLIREGQGIAAGVLESLGIDLAKARAAVLRAFERHEIPLSQS